MLLEWTITKELHLCTKIPQKQIVLANCFATMASERMPRCTCIHLLHGFDNGIPEIK